MTIPNYICELLYRYDCVIIPNFGALLTNRVSAQLSSDKKVFYPPQKRLSFNQQIINNDGLLTNYVSVSEGISYEKALVKVEAFVKNIQQELTDKGRLSLNEIGLFNLNHEQKLVFEPVHTTNYLPEAFGLAMFQTSTIVREVLKEEVVALEEKVPDIAITPEKRSRFQPLLKYAAVIALVAGLGGVFMKSYLDKVDRTNNIEIALGNDMVNDEIQSASFTLDILSPLPSIAVSVNKKETAETSDNIRFHVVAGAFREFANVDKKINQLKDKGFTASYIGENKYGLHQVVYSSYANRGEAVQALNTIKHTEDQGAWLLIDK